VARTFSSWRPGRFTRRAGLRAGLSGALAAPLGREAAAVAAAVGAAQEQAAVGGVLGVAAAVVCGRPVRPTPGRPEGPAGPTGAARPASPDGPTEPTGATRATGGRPGGSGARRYTPAGRAGRIVLGAGIGLATRALWPVASKEPAAVAPHRQWAGLEPAPDGTGLGIVVNSGAGPDRGRPDDPATVLAEELPGAEVVVLDDPAQLTEELVRLARSGCRALGVAGGDGSINTAASVALDHGLPLAVVPAGTLNHLARDLGVSTVADTVTAVRAGTAIEVDVARIAGRPFLNTASFGSYVEIVDARQQLEHRVGKWPALAVAVARTLRHGSPVRVAIDGRTRELWAVFIGNCRYQPAGMAPTWRDRFDDGLLDVRVADASRPFSRARLVAAALTGRLHRSPVLEAWTTTNLRVKGLDGPVRLARDGETFAGTDAFDVVKRGDRLAIYSPHPAPAALGGAAPGARSTSRPA
jgi:undecaprenyl-diphosphatase